MEHFKIACHSTPLSTWASTWELELFTKLTMFSVHMSTLGWSPCGTTTSSSWLKPNVDGGLLMYVESWSSRLWPPSQWAFKHYLTWSIILCFSIIRPKFIAHFENEHFTRSYHWELECCWWWDSQYFESWMKACQLPSIKFLKIASPSFQPPLHLSSSV